MRSGLPGGPDYKFLRHVERCYRRRWISRRTVSFHLNEWARLNDREGSQEFFRYHITRSKKVKLSRKRSR